MSFESDYQPNIPGSISEAKLAETFNAVMARVYLWMTLGLVVTTAVSFYVVTQPAVMNFVFGSFWVLMVLFIAQIALVIALVRSLNKLSTGAALAMFFAYAALNGVTLSSILLAYDLGVVTMAFGVTAVVFTLLTIVGLTTKQDLTKWGPILFFGLIGIILATLVNMFLRSSTLDLIITYLGIIIFLALIVYDTKYIKKMTYAAAAQQGDLQAVIGRISVLGALKLYLDFINLFLYILRLLGRRR
ncbi:MAG: Bax inhibitor-1/YccA family protein [Chloroflexi bacterium]|nr:Bax inhibitor-1/YccA family protein [Chloroflexota bacterium]MBK6711477.1 Bax inhibitor-1/YccA family protein [Chloroflexota bacterium]MBK8935026.1 Bax inhibitor-1/YccA family protein [Chloroflexota bacterium]MBP6802738.1 Bax inhibitor-1/YccA family protein [Chloroflexota bacterium]MBP7592817.1 Bax inhibitor-1/YccA family protein [Chloroflexota bacterium]